MSVHEVAVNYLCGKDRISGILHQPAGTSHRGLLIVYGRPGYRTGTSRLLVLLARAWAESGIPVMRFDYRGSGDCGGDLITLEETSVDIAAAIETFLPSVPGLREVVLWSFCGGAADALLYAARDPRVAGIVLVNPWVYDARARARMNLKHYSLLYLRRLLHPSTWTGGAVGFELKGGLRSLLGVVGRALGIAPADHHGGEGAPGVSVPGLTAAAARVHHSYRATNVSRRLADSLEKFKGRVLLILCGADVNARSFLYAAAHSPEWRRLLSAKRVKRHDLPGADHSFRRREWLTQVAEWTLDWLREF